MKKMILVAAALLFATSAVYAQKTVVVNMVDLVRFHPSRERDRKLMRDTEKEYQAQIDKKRDQFEELRSQYEKLIKEARSPALNDSARQEAENKAMKTRDSLAEADRDLRQEMQKLQRSLSELDNRLLRQVTGEIREVVTAYAQEEKVDLVVDSTTLAYSNPSLEVTDEILKRMGVDPKKRHEAKAAAKAKAAEKSDGEIK